MSYSFPLIVESLVAILLMITILYCVRLNNGIKQFRGQEKKLKSTVAELITATENAERAIADLKTTVREADQTLGERLRASEKFAAEIGLQLKAGESVLNRVTQIAALRPASAPGPIRTPVRAPKPTMTDTKKIMAAAQAFAQRARSRIQGRAA